MSFDDLSIIIPAFNEAQGLPPTLIELTSAFSGAEIIVVDDHSRDDTSQAASRFDGVRVLRHSFNRGQGAALKTGMRAATRNYVAWFDGDCEHRAVDLECIYRRLIGEDLVAVIGQRRGASANLARTAGKWVIRLIGRGLKVKAGPDLNCGLRAFKREAILPYLNLIPDRFSASLVSTLIILERGYPVAFEPVTTRPRVGRSTVQLSDGIEAILQLIRAVLLFAPMRLFLPAGALGIVFGAIYSGTYAVIVGKGIPVAGLFIMLSGMLILFLGLIADQISQMRMSLLSSRIDIQSQFLENGE